MSELLSSFAEASEDSVLNFIRVHDLHTTCPITIRCRDIGRPSKFENKRRLELPDAFLSAIIEDLNDAIFSRDLDATIISWNDSAEYIFSYSATKERMELLGGDLEIHSEPNKGTIAELITPLKEKEETQTKVTDEKQAEAVSATPPLNDL